MTTKDENDDKLPAIEFPITTMGRTKRLLSQIPLPSNGLILRQIPGGNVTIGPVRNRRTVSEQFNTPDR